MKNWKIKGLFQTNVNSKESSSKDKQIVKGQIYSSKFLNSIKLTFHPSEVGKMSARNFWELSGKM